MEMTPQGKANSDTRYSEIFELWDLNADIHESTGQELEFQREENLAERNPELPDGVLNPNNPNETIG